MGDELTEADTVHTQPALGDRLRRRLPGHDDHGVPARSSSPAISPPTPPGPSTAIFTARSLWSRLYASTGGQHPAARSGLALCPDVLASPPNEHRSARGPRPRAVAAGAGESALARGALRALRRARARRRCGDRRRCSNEARPATTGSPHAWSTTARTQQGVALELQPLRWGLRLVPGDASESVAAMCVTRSADGRWLAGRRAQWVASWAGRWALGAGGAVDLGENPADTLVGSCRRSGRSRPRACRERRCCACRTRW